MDSARASSAMPSFVRHRYAPKLGAPWITNLLPAAVDVAAGPSQLFLYWAMNIKLNMGTDE